jgi:hypothetical protein
MHTRTLPTAFISAISLLVPALLPLAIQAQALVTVQLGANESHTTTITNKETRRLASVELSLLPTADAVWDQFDRVSGPAFTIAPTVGTNADGTKAEKITVTTLADKDAPIVATGDIDSTGGLMGVTAKVTWENGVVGAASLQRTGAAPSWTWSATIPPATVPSPGEPAQLSWTPPTMNDDGSPYTNPGGYRVFWGTQSGVYSNNVSLPSPTATAYDVMGLSSNVRYYFAVTAFNTVGDESVYSNEATLIPGILSPDPAPPVGLVAKGATAVLRAYTISTVANALVINDIGSVDAGTACDGTQKVNAWGTRADDQRDLYLIPKGSAGLHLLAGVDPDVVYAQCAAP